MTRKEIESAICAHQAILDLMEIDETELSLTQFVFLKYILLEKIAEVAKEARSAGRRAPNGNSIQPSHVSEILDLSPEDVVPGVQNIAQSIFKKNRKIAYRVWS